MNRWILPAALLVFVSAAQGATYQESQAASPGETLVVDLSSGAGMRITGWDRDSVTVDAEFTGPDADNIRFDIRRNGDRIEISSSYFEQRSRNRAGGMLEIRVPSRFDLRLRTTGGGIHIEGIQGRIEGETMGGELELRDLEGTLDLETYGGNVVLRDSRVDGGLVTHGGNIRLQDVVGAVSASSMGGNVIYDNVDPGPGGAAGDVRISTMGGNVTVPDAPHGATLETMGGDIIVQRAAEYVEAKSMGGNIRIEAVDGWVTARTAGGDIHVTITGAGGESHDARLTSEGGSIRLTVPEDFSMEIDITLAYTRKSDQSYRIRSDFPIETRESEGWDYSSGTPRKYIYGTGRAGGGANKVKIETTNGEVVLIRGR